MKSFIFTNPCTLFFPVQPVASLCAFTQGREQVLIPHSGHLYLTGIKRVLHSTFLHCWQRGLMSCYPISPSYGSESLILLIKWTLSSATWLISSTISESSCSLLPSLFTSSLVSSYFYTGPLPSWICLTEWQPEHSIRLHDLELLWIWSPTEYRPQGSCLYSLIYTLSIKCASFLPSPSISTRTGLRSTPRMPLALYLINRQPATPASFSDSTTQRSHYSCSVSAQRPLSSQSTGFTSSHGSWISLLSSPSRTQ